MVVAGVVGPGVTGSDGDGGVGVGRSVGLVGELPDDSPGEAASDGVSDGSSVSSGEGEGVSSSSPKMLVGLIN